MRGRSNEPPERNKVGASRYNSIERGIPFEGCSPLDTVRVKNEPLCIPNLDGDGIIQNRASNHRSSQNDLTLQQDSVRRFLTRF